MWRWFGRRFALQPIAFSVLPLNTILRLVLAVASAADYSVPRARR